MNYPVWDVALTGGGLLIALVAIIHVFVSHFSVGGGLFLVLTERKGYRDNDPRVVDYVKTHTKFFLLLTVVFGAVTGVGIWLTISAIHPGATSLMIHTFVFAWASEWVFFLVEVVSIFVYYYTFGRMNRRDHLRVGWIYFWAAWLSMVLIGAIVAFMLSPGDWPRDHSFWSGFFNPSFIPSLVFRSALALILAGVYGLITSTRLADAEFRQKMVRYCSLWLVAPFAVLLPAAWWYLQAIPAGAREMILGRNLDITGFVQTFAWLTPVLVIAGLLMMARLPKRLQQVLTVFIVAAALVYMGAFEYMRETGRRPWVVYGVMYSDGLTPAGMQKARQEGLMTSARWLAHRKPSSDQALAAGRELFRLACVSCHSLGGPRNDVLQLSRGMHAGALVRLMRDMGKGNLAQMPPFPGTRRESWLVARYLVALREGRPGGAF